MIHHDETDGIAFLRLDHGKANAFDLELCHDITSALKTAEDSGARAVVMTGTGSIFSAGVDLFRLVEGGADYVAEFLPALTRCLDAAFDFPRPLVAAINGHAIAGGCILAQTCDIRMMADGEGRIGAPELRVGVPFPVTAIETMRFAVPGQHLQKILYTGGTWSPSEAMGLGLLDEVIPGDQLIEKATSTARRLADVPARSFASVKKQVRAPARDRREQSKDIDDEIASTWSAPETLEAVRNYTDGLKKRKGQ